MPRLSPSVTNLECVCELSPTNAKVPVVFGKVSVILLLAVLSAVNVVFVCVPFAAQVL